jgi:peptidoglycan/LPS O-acetylase OafA/YrhL
MQFTAGALACAAVRKLDPSDRTRRAAGYASIVLIAAIVGALYYFSAHPVATVRDAGGLVDVLFVPLVVTLSIGAGSLPQLLSTRVLVYLGQISFALYMVHELVHTAWNWTAQQFEITLTGHAGKFILMGLLALTLAFSSAMYHLVEEPARRWMRRMVDIRGVAGGGRRLEPIDTAHETRAEALSVRAG